MIVFTSDLVREFDFPIKIYASKYYAEQLIRSFGSAALNYGEFAGAGTSKDKINKLRICLKELKECKNNLRIQLKANLLKNDETNLVYESLQLSKIVATIIKNQK
ncbi:MAG: four helix bundle protein [Nonlabens sp.]